MTLLGAIIAVLIIVCLGVLGHWVINKFFPEPARMIALAIVGVILLLILFGAFFPEIGGYRIWGK